MAPKKDLIKGTLRLIVLKLLAENTRMYGYEITQRVKELTNDEIELTFGALYPTLHKLEAEKILVAKTVVIDNRARKYYSLNKEGVKTAKREIAEYFTFTKSLNLVLKP
ncbi:MAG: helix-turn-helix transcriptional regulator [Cyclobacteriaceae bacterium]|jgi:DNA-binding PadR family transcriptional regulator|nr:helix-turn-helix transcriptional regulator [Cyclobacteriaceae bacterium]